MSDLDNSVTVSKEEKRKADIEACIGVVAEALARRHVDEEEIDLTSLLPGSVPRTKDKTTFITYPRDLLVETIVTSVAAVKEWERKYQALSNLSGDGSSGRTPPTSSSNSGTGRGITGGGKKVKQVKAKQSEREAAFAARTVEERVCKQAWSRHECPDKAQNGGACKKIHPILCDKEDKCADEAKCIKFHGFKETRDEQGKVIKREKKKKPKSKKPSRGNGGGTGPAAGQSPTSGWRQELKRRQAWDRQQRIPPWAHKGQQFYQNQQLGHWQQQGPQHGQYQ
jgi:hypothetical protein